MNERGEHRWAVDSLEEDMARVEEDGTRMITVPRWLLPSGAREGQQLRVTRSPGEGAGSVSITVAVDDTGTAAALAKSKATMTSAMAASKQRDPGGDVAL